MANPDSPPSAVDPRLAELLRIAAELRDLPSPRFKSGLRAALDAAARSDAPRLAAHDLRALLASASEPAARVFASLDRFSVGVARLARSPGWERNPGGDALLHVLEGEAEVATLLPAGPVWASVRAGSFVVCPQGLWHRIEPRTPVSLLFATPRDGTERSDEAPRPERGGPGGDGAPAPSAHDPLAAAAHTPLLAISPETTPAEADAAFRKLASFDRYTLGVTRFSGRTPWERHPDGDELLHALEGEVELTVLTDDGTIERTLRAGSLFVCPRGLWHRQLAPRSVTLLYGTAIRTSQISFADDPRA